MKRMLSILLALFICAMTLPAFAEPLMEEPTEVTWATVENWYPSASYTDGLEVWERMAEKTNIRINWEVLPDDQYLVSMQTRLASAQNLPDILRVPGGDPTYYGQMGLLIPMNDLIDQYAPNIQWYFNEKYPITGKLMRSGDGNYYDIAPIIVESSHTMPNYLMIRKDWLDVVGKDVPTTTDEWLDVLRAFKEMDANGDGDPSNEIPFSGDPLFFCGAFGLHLWSSTWQGGFFTDDEGKVYYQFTDDRMVDLLAFLNTMWNEGLIDPDYGNPSADTLLSKFMRNIVGSMNNWPDYGIGWPQRMAAEYPNVDLVPVVPPIGPNGDQSQEGYGSVDSGFAGISKDCANPEAAIKVMDYMWSEEGRIMLAYGIEGKTYDMVDGVPVLNETVLHNPDGLGASDVLRTYGAWPTIPWVQQEGCYLQMMASDPDWANAADTCLAPYYVEPFPWMLATKEEQEQLSVMLNDINTYREEQITKFIRGERSLDTFDAFKLEMEGLGLEQVLAIKQAQWDRTFNAD